MVKTNVKSGLRKVKSTCKLKRTYDRGFLESVSNSCGNKGTVVIFQGVKPGFSVKELKSGKVLNITDNNAELLAENLAKQGYKKVIFAD